MRKNVIQRIWEAAGRFRAKTGLEPTVVYLGASECVELQDLVGKLRYETGSNGLRFRFSGRRLLFVTGRYLAVGI